MTQDERSTEIPEAEIGIRRWQDIEPADATDLDLSVRLDITAPHNELGERCPWPWEPQQLVGVPLGQYRCGYCLAMCVAGMEHVDYGREPWLDKVAEEIAQLDQER